MKQLYQQQRDKERDKIWLVDVHWSEEKNSLTEFATKS